MTKSNPSVFSIACLNDADLIDATRMLERITERSGWLARRIALQRPFVDAADLFAQLQTLILSLNADECLTLLNAHPELAPSAPEQMTEASRDEQGRLALASPEGRIAERMQELNAAYRARFGFPFVVALHAFEDMHSVVASFESRLANSREAEVKLALNEIVSVAHARLARIAGITPPLIDTPAS